MNLLQIKASARREGAHSTRIANALVYAEGLNRGPEAMPQGLAEAEAEMAAILA